jgi:hypothetical protein
MHRYQIILIVDRNYGPKLHELPVGGPVWIIDTPGNHDEIVELRRIHGHQGYMEGITSFKDRTGISPEDVVLEMIDTIYDHHGPNSHNPPMNAIRIIGSKKTSEICNWFRRVEFNEIIGIDFDFVIQKKHYK